MSTKPNRIEIKDFEHAVIQPHLQRIHKECDEFGSFWMNHKMGICLIISTIIFIISLFPIKGEIP